MYIRPKIATFSHGKSRTCTLIFSSIYDNCFLGLRYCKPSSYCLFYVIKLSYIFVKLVIKLVVAWTSSKLLESKFDLNFSSDSCKIEYLPIFSKHCNLQQFNEALETESLFSLVFMSPLLQHFLCLICFQLKRISCSSRYKKMVTSKNSSRSTSITLQ